MAESSKMDTQVEQVVRSAAGRSRPPVEIWQMVGWVREAWEKNPYLRLGELIAEATTLGQLPAADPRDLKDPRLVKDDVLVRGLQILSER